MKITLTRPAFCELCAMNQRPQTGNIYAVHGSTGWHVHEVEYAIPRYNPYGFTPHIFEIKKTESGIVYGDIACCMDDCGLDIRKNQEHEYNSTKPAFLIYYNHKKPFSLQVNEWNALVIHGKTLGYRLE